MNRQQRQRLEPKASFALAPCLFDFPSCLSKDDQGRNKRHHSKDLTNELEGFVIHQTGLLFGWGGFIPSRDRDRSICGLFNLLLPLISYRATRQNALEGDTGDSDLLRKLHIGETTLSSLFFQPLL